MFKMNQKHFMKSHLSEASRYPQLNIAIFAAYLREAVGKTVGKYPTTSCDVIVAEVLEILTCFSIESGQVRSSWLRNDGFFWCNYNLHQPSKYEVSSFKFPDEPKMRKESLETA